jgi:hypothetical protein
MEGGNKPLDLILPIPVQTRDKIQNYVVTHRMTEKYTYGDWVLDGNVTLFGLTPKNRGTKEAQLCFGKNDTKLCLKVQFEDDDKHEASCVIAHENSRTMVGSIHGFTFVFHPYPFQESRLRRLLETNLVANLTSFIGVHIRECMFFID